MARFICCAALLLLSAGPGFAADSEGTSAAQFLRIGVGARESALGETGAVVSGALGMFYNPAGLGDVTGTELALSQVKWVMDVNYSNLAVARNCGFGVLGLSVNYLSMPKIDKYDKLGNKLDASFTAADMAAALGYGVKLSPRLGLGASARYISSSLDDKTAAVVAFDAGVKYAAVPGVLVIGAALQNAGAKLKYETESSPLPLNAKFGGAYTLTLDRDTDLQKNISFFADVNRMKDSGLYGNAGLDFMSVYRDGTSFSFRGGYRTNAADKDAGASLGLGIGANAYLIDYSYSLLGDLGQAHRLSVTLKFGAGS
ncbi:MAG TPA: PorV/PorQ family protein [Elusimicrobiales bacterium]|nr:PorV/PorQ family protein [Elusimicrobiales bacterium]